MDFTRLYALKPTSREELEQISEGILALARGEENMTYNAALHDALVALPIYGDHECAGIDGQCTRPACIRHPMSGKFYCSGHALQLAESHKVELEDIQQVLHERQGMLRTSMKCEFCEKPAERRDSFCQASICFDHFSLIPRTGAACPDCALGMEQEAEEQERY